MGLHRGLCPVRHRAAHPQRRYNRQEQLSPDERTGAPRFQGRRDTLRAGQRGGAAAKFEFN